VSPLNQLTNEQLETAKQVRDALDAALKQIEANRPAAEEISATLPPVTSITPLVALSSQVQAVIAEANAARDGFEKETQRTRVAVMFVQIIAALGQVAAPFVAPLMVKL